MSTGESNIDFTSVIEDARKGDEDAFEFIYNHSVRTCRAYCMLYFDPAEETGRRKTDAAVKEVFVRLYDGLQTLQAPEDYPELSRGIAKDVCLEKAAGETVQLEAESYIGVGETPEDIGDVELVTADDCRREVRGETMLSDETIGTMTLAILHLMTGAERLALLRWNAGDPAAMKAPDVLRSAFIKAEKAVMDFEQKTTIRALDFADSRIAFFNRLLDLYIRSYEATSKHWVEAKECAWALDLAGDLPPDTNTLAAEAGPLHFTEVWTAVRERFYLQNTMELPKGVTDPDYRVYLDGDAEDPAEEEAEKAPPRKKSFLGTWWGRTLLALLIIVLVLLAVVATAGQHTSHAQTLSVQIADLAVEQVCVFNVS